MITGLRYRRTPSERGGSGDIGQDSAKVRYGHQIFGDVIWAVVQEVLLFGSESWVLSKAMEKTSEGEHPGFPKKIKGNQAHQMAGRK